MTPLLKKILFLILIIEISLFGFIYPVRNFIPKLLSKLPVFKISNEVYFREKEQAKNFLKNDQSDFSAKVLRVEKGKKIWLLNQIKI